MFAVDEFQDSNNANRCWEFQLLVCQQICHRLESVFDLIWKQQISFR